MPVVDLNPGTSDLLQQTTVLFHSVQAPACASDLYLMFCEMQTL